MRPEECRNNHVKMLGFLFYLATDETNSVAEKGKKRGSDRPLFLKEFNFSDFVLRKDKIKGGVGTKHPHHLPKVIVSLTNGLSCD